MMNINLDPKLLISQSVPSNGSKNIDKDNPQALRKTCQEFEAIFLHSLFKSMRASVPDGGIIEKDNGMEIHQDMMDIEVSRTMSQTQSIGIADALFEQLLGKKAAE